MSFSFALPAAASATSGATTGAAAGQAAGQAGVAGDPLGLFGQLLAMLGVDPEAAGQLDAKSLVQTLGKAASQADAADGQNDDKAKDEAKTEAGATPVDLSALIAALLAIAPQPAPAPSNQAVDGEEAAPAVSMQGKAAAPLEAQLETLLAALTGQVEPEGAEAAPNFMPQGAASVAKAEIALAAPKIEAPVQASTPSVAPAPAIQAEPVRSIQSPAPVETTLAPLVASEAATAVVQAIIPGQKPAATPTMRPAAAKPAPAAPLADTDASQETRGAQDPAAPAQAQPKLEAPLPSLAKPADLAALPGAELAAKAADKPAEDDAPQSLAANAAPQAAATNATGPMAAPAEVRGSPETVAKLAAQIVKKLETRTTRFEVALDPIGLGRVDVKLEIGANGKLHAQMSFDNPAAASDLRGRASQLREVLEQAGFDLKGGSLSFDVAGQGGQGRGQHQQQQQQDGQPRFAGSAGVFEAALNLGDTPITAPVWAKNSAASGVDIRI